VQKLLHEYKRYGDLMLMNATEDGDLPKLMLLAWQWSVRMSRGKYLFLIKVCMRLWRCYANAAHITDFLQTDANR
jgi:hypothetical protein